MIERPTWLTWFSFRGEWDVDKISGTMTVIKNTAALAILDMVQRYGPRSSTNYTHARLCPPSPTSPSGALPPGFISRPPAPVGRGPRKILRLVGAKSLEMRYRARVWSNILAPTGASVEHRCSTWSALRVRGYQVPTAEHFSETRRRGGAEHPVFSRKKKGVSLVA